VRHFGYQRLAEAQVPAPAGGGVVSGKGDLGGNSATAPPARGAGSDLGGTPGGSEGGGRASLRSRSGGLQSFKRRDLGDQRGFAGVRIDHQHIIEHAFDATSTR
jgi:hypothetical protein